MNQAAPPTTPKPRALESANPSGGAASSTSFLPTTPRSSLNQPRLKGGERVKILPGRERDEKLVGIFGTVTDNILKPRIQFDGIEGHFFYFCHELEVVTSPVEPSTNEDDDGN